MENRKVMLIAALREVYKEVNGKLLLNNINVEVNKGEIITLIGPNGAGKTTLIRVLMGLENPTKGEVHIHQSLKIGYVPQKIERQEIMPLPCIDLVKLISGRTQLPADLADFCNFDSLYRKDISSLSAGQRQKLLISATFAAGYDFLVLDEPTQSMDLASQERFYSLLSKIRDQGATIFTVSHDLFTVMKNSDKVVCLNSQICCTGTKEDIGLNNEFTKSLKEVGFYNHHHPGYREPN